VGHSVVCVSRSLGAGGEAVGRGVAQRLGFRYVDEEVISLASEKAGIDPAVVAKAEEHTTFLSRLMDALAATPMEVEHLLPLHQNVDRVPRARSSETFPDEELRRFIQAAIVEIADRGKAVIVAHGGSIALAGRKDVLRTLVTASVATRRGRLWPGRLLNEQEGARGRGIRPGTCALSRALLRGIGGGADPLRPRAQHGRRQRRAGRGRHRRRDGWSRAAIARPRSVSQADDPVGRFPGGASSSR